MQQTCITIGIVGSLITTIRNFGQVTGTAIGIQLFQIGADRFEGNYDSAMNFALAFSVVIGVVRLILLLFRLKRVFLKGNNWTRFIFIDRL